jgi:hypothetical protein
MNSLEYLLIWQISFPLTEDCTKHSSKMAESKLYVPKSFEFVYNMDRYYEYLGVLSAFYDTRAHKLLLYLKVRVQFANDNDNTQLAQYRKRWSGAFDPLIDLGVAGDKLFAETVTNMVDEAHKITKVSEQRQLVNASKHRLEIDDLIKVLRETENARAVHTTVEKVACPCPNCNHQAIIESASQTPAPEPIVPPASVSAAEIQCCKCETFTEGCACHCHQDAPAFCCNKYAKWGSCSCSRDKAWQRILQEE